MKKTVLLCLLIFTLLFAISCSGKTPDTGDFVCEFNKETKTVSVNGYNGKDTEVSIPEKFGKYTVTSIGRKAFSNLYEIKSITLPSTVTSIGPSAFEYCISIKEFTIPTSVKEIGNTAFSNCRGLKSISIPSSVTSIGICAFTGCTSLESIKVDGNNEYYTADSYGVLMDKAETTVIQFPLGSERPSYLMPDTVTRVLSYAFENASYLENVTFSENLEVIESYAFQKCAVNEAIFSDSLKEIGSFAFNESKLTKLELGNNIKTIGDSAFSWCTSLSEVNLPATVEKIGNSAFFMCDHMEKYTVAQENAYYSSDEQGCLFDKDKTVLMYYPVANEAKEYTVPQTVTTIAASAFSPTLNLTKVVIPDSVTTIEENAFVQCPNLNDVIYEGTPPENIADNAFEE